MRTPSRLGLCLALLQSAFLCTGASTPRPQNSRANDTSSGPRLVVVLSVDSMIPEQLDRLRPWWTGGFRRLLEEGTVFTAARLPYALTESAPGHASFGTGCLPATHGITRDALIESGTGRQQLCVADDSTRTISSYDWPVAERMSASAVRLRRAGWAEALREAWPRSRSISISGKASAAVLLAGRAPDLALWWDSYGRGFVSSSAYCEALPGWLATWNADWAEHVRDWAWTAELPEAGTRTGADDRPGEAAVGGMPPVFPYPPPQLPEELGPRDQASLAGRVFGSPLMDRVVCDAAERAVVAEALGRDDEVDLLTLGLSACGLLTAATGPYSLEVTDTLLRLDRELGELFEFLDRELGAEHWLVALSSDHGILELPEADARVQPGGVRLPVRARRQALQLLRSSLQQEFGRDFGANLTIPGDGVTFTELKPQAGEENSKAVNPALVRASAAQALETLPWVAGAYTREELMAAETDHQDSWLALARASYHRDSGAEVELRLAHRHLLGILVGTRSGSPYPYDRRQPLILMGPGFAPGSSDAPASSLDALPTVLGRLGRSRRAEADGVDLLGD
jgi:hypothetical protein